MVKCPPLKLLPDRDMTEQEINEELLQLENEYLKCQKTHNKLIDAIKAREAQA